MSLFIGMLAFACRPELETETTIGVLAGSLVCMAPGALMLRFSPGEKGSKRDAAAAVTAKASRGQI